MEKLLLRAEICDLRNSERRRIAVITQKYYRGLSAQIENTTMAAPRRQILSGHRFFRKKIAPLVNDWIAEQEPKLCARINASAQQSHDDIELAAYQSQTSWSTVSGVGAGAGLVLAPIAALPFLGGFATVSTTSFLVLTTATVSLPVLGGLVAIGGVAALSGRQILVAQERKHRARLVKRFQRIAEQSVLGREHRPSSRSLLQHLTGQIDEIAKIRLDKLL